MGSNKIIGVLGDYITLVSRKNKNLEVTKLVGVSSKKEFLEVDEDMKRINLEQYFILSKNQFAVDLVSVARVNKLPIALNTKKERLLISSIYKVFEINKPYLKNEYLMLLFTTQNIDKQSVFWSGTGVRGFLTWTNFCKLKICFPSLEIQERIVNKYQTVTKYIEVKKKINELLEKQMKAYFHLLFDDLKDYEVRSFGELFSIIKGGRPPRSNRYLEELYYCQKGGIPFLQVRDITKKEFKFVRNTAEQLTKQGFKRGNCSMVSSDDLIFIHNASSKQLGNIYVNSCNLTINSNFWAFSNSLAGGGINIAYL